MISSVSSLMVLMIVVVEGVKNHEGHVNSSHVVARENTFHGHSMWKRSQAVVPKHVVRWFWCVMNWVWRKTTIKVLIVYIFMIHFQSYQLPGKGWEHSFHPSLFHKSNYNRRSRCGTWAQLAILALVAILERSNTIVLLLGCTFFH